MVINMKLGENIKELLEQYGMTQKQLAEELALSPSAMGNYIQNIREPDYATLVCIADYFHVTTDFLLNHTSKGGHTHKEEMLLQIFRALSEEQRELYLEQGKVFVKQNQKKELLRSRAEGTAQSDVS